MLLQIYLIFREIYFLIWFKAYLYFDFEYKHHAPYHKYHKTSENLHSIYQGITKE